MRTVACWLAGSLALVALGCSGGGATSPTAPSTNGSSLPTGTESAPLSVSGSLGTAMQSGDLQTSALAIYTVDINTDTLTATSHLKETRSGQANDDLYMLSIDSFLNAGSFQITNVSADIDSVDLGYAVTHPFPAPSNPTGTPNGSTNRADLGISGMVLFLADVGSATGNTYFTDRVANTALVTNPDAYFSPGGLLTTTGIANTYPYRQLVDEVADSRDGISNSGDTTGNFGTDGWTRSEFGGTNDGWTGYGVLHQGQASKSTVSLDKDELAGGFSLDVAIVAKYNDPRGGATPAEKKANRLPPAAADASLFAYRMPHGALDGASISYAGAGGLGFIANNISDATLYFHVTDPDARATETTEADLSADASFTNVAVGEAGIPTVEVCIPGVLGDATTVVLMPTVQDDDTGWGGDAGVDSGNFGDPLFFCESITKGASTGQTAGDFTGMVRVTDPETGLVIGLDGNLAPLAVTPAAITYQSFTIAQAPDNAAPSAVVTLTSADPMLSGTSAALAITSLADADLDPLDVLVDWGDGGGFVSVATGLTGPAYLDQTPTGPQMNNADLVVDTINMTVRITDGVTPTDYPVGYDLGPNRAPVVTGTPALATASLPPPATFTMNAGTSTATDPEGDTVSYTITNDGNADVVSFASFPNGANTTPFGSPGIVTFTIYANDALHATTSGTAYPTVAGTVAAAGCPAYAPAGGTAVTGAHVYAGATTVTGSFWGWSEVSAFKSNNAWSDDFIVPTTPSSAGPFSISRYSAAGALNPTAMLTVTSAIQSGQTSLLDVDAQDRIVLSHRIAASGLDSWTPASMYTAGLPSTNVRWFTYTGGATLAAFDGSLTTPSPIVALTLDESGNLFVIGQDNILRRYDRTAGGYTAEIVTAPYPIDLKTGAYGLTPTTTWRVHDFVLDSVSDAIFILAQSNLAQPNGRILRVECDGAVNATLNGNPNPVNFSLNNTTFHSVSADIWIDERGATGALLGAQGQRQIVVTSPNTTVAAPDIRIFNSDLLNYANGPDLSGTLFSIGQELAINRTDVLLTKGTSSYTNSARFTTAPTGWQ